MKLQPTIVTSVHSYTREDVPWDMTDNRKGRRGRLAHFLAGGGIRTFGRTISQQKAAQSHFRFWMLSAALAVLWLVFYFI